MFCRSMYAMRYMTTSTGIRWRMILRTMMSVCGSSAIVAASGGAGGRLALAATAEDPQRAGQGGEIRQQRKDERGGGHDSELPHRGQIGKRQREKAARVDQRGEQDRPAGNQHRVPQGGSGSVTRAFLEVIEEMNLVVLRGTQHGGGDENRGDIEWDSGQ